MVSDNPQATARIGRHPIHALLVPFPLTCFVGALITDLVYWKSAATMWETFSIWLIAAGLVMAAFAVIAGIIDFAASRRIRALRPAWPHALGNAVALLLALINAFVHSRDGYTAVVPTGLTLSALVVVILLVTSWQGADMVYRHRVGVSN